MKTAEFEKSKVKNAIKRNGVSFSFKRYKLNEFGEKTKEFVKDSEDIEKDMIIEVKGIYHEQTSYVKKIVGDSATTRTKKSPMILCLMEDTALLLERDIVEINGKSHELVKVVDVQNLNVVADLSLEVVDNGSK